MATERSYSKGQRLRALLMSFQLGITFAAALKKLPQREEDPLDSTALDLQGELVEHVRDRRIGETYASEESKRYCVYKKNSDFVQDRETGSLYLIQLSTSGPNRSKHRSLCPDELAEALVNALNS